MTHTLDSLVVEISRWQSETFPSASPSSTVDHLLREAAELHNWYWSGDGVDLKRTPPRDEVAEEIADVFHLLVAHANSVDVDLVSAVRAKFEKNKGRTWKAPDARGVVEHRDPEEPLFYIQDTRQCVGNSVLWWRPDSKGYTTHIDEAGKYPASFKVSDPHVLWPVEEVDAIWSRHVDMQHLRQTPTARERRSET